MVYAVAVASSDPINALRSTASQYSKTASLAIASTRSSSATSVYVTTVDSARAVLADPPLWPEHGPALQGSFRPGVIDQTRLWLALE